MKVGPHEGAYPCPTPKTDRRLPIWRLVMTI